MTKADLVEKIQSTIGLTRKDSVDIVEEVFAIIKDTLEAGKNVKIAGFGNFEVKQKKDRRGRNPQTGEPIVIRGRNVLTYKVSALLKQEINKQGV